MSSESEHPIQTGRSRPSEYKALCDREASNGNITLHQDQYGATVHFKTAGTIVIRAKIHGTTFLTIRVSSAGPVLLYAAEDSESALRLRLESLAQHHRLQLGHLHIRVITADSLRLDRIPDQQRLEATLMLHRPVLLI